MGTFGRELCPAGETDRRKRSARSDLGPDRRYLTGKNPPNNPITFDRPARGTKAAEFQARALCEANEMTRLHFDNLAKDYLQLAELAAQIDNLRAAQDRRFR